MFTIANGIILKGENLIPSRENIVVDDGKIIEIGKESKEGKIIDVDGAIVCPSFINGHMHIGDSIIKDEGLDLLLSIINLKKPFRILEVGTAVGFSSIMMALNSKAFIDTIERNKVMYQKAIENVKLLELDNRIRVFFGDAVNFDLNNLIIVNEDHIIKKDESSVENIKLEIDKGEN